MKKFAFILSAILLLGGAASATKEENGALGIGVLSESKEGSFLSSNLRGALFLDVGYNLTGPIYYGFEFQGDLKKMGESQFAFRETDLTIIGFSNNDWAIFVDTTNYTKTYTLWELDFSPRGYFSFDLGDKVQLLAFGGVNYNWQTLDLAIKVNSGLKSIKGKYYGPNSTNGDTYRQSENVGSGFWSLVAGFRASVGAFYLDYTRFLDDSNSQVSWNAFNKDRVGLGISLRF